MTWIRERKKQTTEVTRGGICQLQAAVHWLHLLVVVVLQKWLNQYRIYWPSTITHRPTRSLTLVSLNLFKHKNNLQDRNGHTVKDKSR